MESTFFGKDGLIWWKGVVEDRKDPLFLGRVRVRIFGWHTEDKAQMSTGDLPWAIPSLPPDNGRNVVGYKEGDWCWGFFLDGIDAQRPIVVGFVPGIDSDKSNPERGFYDPTPDEQLDPTQIPRPPEMSPPNLDAPAEGPAEGRFDATENLPGSNIAFGELKSKFSISTTKFDINKDGTYNEQDAQKIIELNTADGGFFNGYSGIQASFPISRYPLENRLNEPTTSRLARNEKIEETIVGAKNGTLGTGEGAGFSPQDAGAESPALPFMEPPSPYAAVYPYNHVYESESGHVVEIDDTPGAERMHWYHRTGTFTEIHPNGIEVNRVVKQQYNFIYEEYFLASGKSVNIDAKQEMRFKSGADMNRVVGGNLNAEVGSNYHLAAGGSVYIHAKGVVYVKAAEAVSIQAEGDVDLISGKAIHLRAPQIHLDGTVHAPNPPYPSPEAPANENDADKKAPAAASLKEGFMLPMGMFLDTWKPISESDGKLVTLSADATPHTITEALPTGQLEGVMIKYKHADLTETVWEAVRPVHVPGKFIDAPKSGTMFEDGIRYLQRWSKPGGEYPQQVFWITGSAQHLILDSSVRHMNWGSFNDKIPFDLNPTQDQDNPADAPENDLPDDGTDDGGL